MIFRNTFRWEGGKYLLLNCQMSMISPLSTKIFGCMLFR